MLEWIIKFLEEVAKNTIIVPEKDAKDEKDAKYAKGVEDTTTNKFI